ncbi:hypothetical protein [Spelaeicoccus albus]|uniref:Metal-dependent amidase/aminoacylase/carboxypeptidase family protein n=1 Tax=Spelaeicoccus albus TaxID=1280376 RepID=A0A7Z0AD24_9MICO|nr:hypothetical protein [Spelaeicoccus albus]NYI67176.1 metal-dependent amidase/aminoacylase/carboxypeptidase family protein [Spelaeicoccus albus]
MTTHDVLAKLDSIRGWQEDLYKDLHSHPELSHQEHRTAEIVRKRLSDFGFEVTSGIGGTGVVGASWRTARVRAC